MNHFSLTLLFLTCLAAGCSQPQAQNEDLPDAPTASSEESLISEIPDNGAEAVKENGRMLYRKSQSLMKEGKFELGYATAKKAMEQFIADDEELAWMILESIEIPDKRIDVHFNMGEREREMPENGIVRPLSFRIWAAGDDPKILRIVDFEIGRSGGESATAAIGEMSDTGHTNLGIIAVDASYETIRQQVIDLVKSE